MTHWIILFNDQIVSDETDLLAEIGLIAPLAESMHIAKELFKLTKVEELPESLDYIFEEHPGIESCISFDRAPVVTPADVLVLAERTTPLDLKIAQTAATGLLEGMEDKFSMNAETGFLQVNEDCPPTLEDAETMLDRILGVTKSAERLNEFGNWQLGALLDTMEERFGEGSFSIEQFGAMTGDAAYVTVITSLGTFRAFRDGRYKLSFTHHKEAHYCKLPNDDDQRTEMHRLMRISEYFQLTCLEQRKLMTYHKAYGVENLEPDIDTDWEFDEEKAEEIRSENPEAILDRQDLVERISVRDPRRVFIFTLGGRRYRIKGTETQLPTGASSVIDVNNWMVIQPGGEETAIPAWEETQEE